MADPGLMDRMFQRIMRGLVDTGRAPHYAELARALGSAVEDGRRLLHDVMQAYPIGWLHPDTDYIASFPPLNNLPTQYRITVRGEQRWFAQCGFEATSATWLFPGETVRVDAPCLDCGEPVSIMRDGRIVWSDPPGVVGHLNFGFGRGFRAAPPSDAPIWNGSARPRPSGSARPIRCNATARSSAAPRRRRTQLWGASRTMSTRRLLASTSLLAGVPALGSLPMPTA